MRKSFVALLLLLGVAVSANLAFSDELNGGLGEGLKLTNAQMQKELMSRAQKLRTSAAPGTIYVGFTPGKFNSTNNWWSIGSGTGAGFHRPHTGAGGRGGMWDFDSTVNGDSLQGWWPLLNPYTSTGGQTRTDRNRPWWAFDAGNVANYVINDGPAGATGQKRTFGVVGVWHVDGGSSQASTATTLSGSTTPGWAPLAGSKSVWMGLRAHGDVSGTPDALTNNYYNEDVIKDLGTDGVSASGNDYGFPGYASQMDQMLYRDISTSGHTSGNLTISYSFRTNMSTGFGTAAGTRTGWFDKDPLAPTGGATNPQQNNFISSSDADVLAPVDSFMVYVGAPVTGTTFVGSDGATHPVYDPLRRWFSELVRTTEGGWSGATGTQGNLVKELESAAGNNAASVRTAVIPFATWNTIAAASGGKVRLVFRVKTNRGFDDTGTAYSSGGLGAAVVDNVNYDFADNGVGNETWPGGVDGQFENATDVNNSSGVDPLNAWKSTGKPPGINFHVHGGLGTSLAYDDLCGQPGDVSRICDMDGVVLSAGNHDLGEAAGGLVDGTATREPFDGCMSPAIQLGGPYTFAGSTNAIGLTAAGADATEDYYLDTEIYAGIFDPFSKGNLWQYGFQSYPANSKSSGPGVYAAWGERRTPPYIIFNPDQQCFRDLLDHPIKANSQLKTSNGSGIPDSCRIMVQKRQQCFRFGVSAGCSPTDGAYWDNISLTLIDGEPAALGVSIWDLFQDSFPANDNPALVGFPNAFDTTAAYVKSGINIAPSIGALRVDVPGDSAAVVGGDPTASGVRVDLVFRIMPGPGNYVNPNNGLTSRLRKLPNAVTEVANSPAVTSSNFWESYLANAGAFGTPGGHPTNGGGQKIWSVNVWNSARCDTAEASGVFAFQGRGVLGGPADPGIWQTTYHESELALRTGVGITRHKCFVSTPGGNTAVQDCVHDPPATGGDFDLTWVTLAGSGYNGIPTTTEGTKILPDGYFTPGTHVEYFFRKSDAATGTTVAGIMPDTGSVFPQNLEGSTDAHRWQEFSILPDRWKDAGKVNPNGLVGIGNACLLVVDQNDRRGNERVWVGIADTLGATRSNKYGAHNGWHARGGQDVNDPTQFVAVHGGSPGTTWDMYQVKASESLNTSSGALGSRLAVQATDAQMHGKESRQGPTPDMLDTYYKFMFMMSGDLNSGVLGPFDNRSQDDITLLTNWLTGGSTTAPGNRGFWAMGDGFVESNDGEGLGSPQFSFNTDVLGVSLVRNSYTLESGNTELTPDLFSASAITTPGGGPCPYPTGCNFSGHVYGVRNVCLWTNDVIQAEPTSPVSGDMAAGNRYEGAFTYQAGELKKFSTSFPWVALTDGYDIENLTGRDNEFNSNGRIDYFAAALANVFGQVCGVAGTPVIALDVPNSGSIRDFGFALRGNPMLKSTATIVLSMPRSDRVSVKILDVTGRLVKTLTDGQSFPAGEKILTWDGSTDAGRQAMRGVYFTQVRYLNSKITLANKLTVLR
jgi:hypothetical protein